MNDNNPGGSLRKADPKTIQNKFLVGYQGWFTCQGDGAPVHAGHHGWLHWVDRPIPEGGRPNMDLWPDVSAYSPSELFPVPGLTLPDGQPACLFSSRHPRTVQRHFHWMAEHGVDGCFLQRFTSQIESDGNERGPKADLMRLRDEIGDRVKEAAEKEGRVFAIMYDVSGAPADQLQKILEVDWNHLIRRRALLDSPNYLREKGRPVVAIWGVGFAKNQHNPAVIRQIVRNMRAMTPGGAYVIAGTPTRWQTLDGDADSNPGFLDIYYNEFDAISPWTVGRYRGLDGADRFASHRIHGDMQAIQQNCGGRIVDYIPVVWPGGSEHHLSNKQREPNFAPREGGKFLWRQISNAMAQGAKIIYGAMWDEYDEGTAVMPVVSYKSNLPREARFLALDVDGYDLPSDWFMRICGLAAESLRGERRIEGTFPKKELDDYWSSRPRYASKIVETSRPTSSSGFVSGSGVAHRTSVPSIMPASTPASNSGSAVIQKPTTSGVFDADQEQGNEEAPPPYSLEASEVSKPSTVDRPVTSDPMIQPSQQLAPSGSSSVGPRTNFESHHSMESLSTQNLPQPPAPAIPSSPRPASESHYQLSMGEVDSIRQSPSPQSLPHPMPHQDTFVGGFGQGQSSNPPARSVSEATSFLVDEFHRYQPYGSSAQPTIVPHSAHASTLGGFHQPTAFDSPSQHYAPSQSSTTAMPTHMPHPPMNPFPNANHSSSPHPQFPPVEWELQNKPTSQPNEGCTLPYPHYGGSPLPVPPPRHPSISSKPSTSSGPHSVATNPPGTQSSPYVNYGQFPQAPPHQPYSTYPQSHVSIPPDQSHSTHPQTNVFPPPFPPRPAPASSSSAWGMVDKIAGMERRKKLEQGVDSVVKQNNKIMSHTMDAVAQSVDSVMHSGKKILGYKPPGQK